MSLCTSHQDKQRLITRLKRVNGQINGIIKMIEDDKDCIDVIRQITSISGAIKGAWFQVVKDHLKGCIQHATLEGEDGNKHIEQLIENMKSIYK